MNEAAETARSRRGLLCVPCTLILQLVIGCAETTLDAGTDADALAPHDSDHREQVADWPMPDAVRGSKVKPNYSASQSDAVVLDNITGLAWQRDVPAKFPEQTCTAGDGCTWEEAKAYCDDLVIGERHDFRLPSKIELESIVDDTQRGLPMDPEAFPEAEGGIFWTASPLLGATERAWIVAFSNGVTFGASTDERLRVRCVHTERRVSSHARPRYTVDSTAVPATVADAHTGLIWQLILDSAKHKRAGAQAYCASLGADWRLPTKKELLTLVDPTIAPSGTIPAIAPEFAGTPIDANFWSGTPAANNARYGWLVNVSGPAFVSAEPTLAHVRCVR